MDAKTNHQAADEQGEGAEKRACDANPACKCGPDCRCGDNCTCGANARQAA
jgi:hypothetical protein